MPYKDDLKDTMESMEALMKYNYDLKLEDKKLERVKSKNKILTDIHNELRIANEDFIKKNKAIILENNRLTLEKADEINKKQDKIVVLNREISTNEKYLKEIKEKLHQGEVDLLKFNGLKDKIVKTQKQFIVAQERLNKVITQGKQEDEDNKARLAELIKREDIATAKMLEIDKKAYAVTKLEKNMRSYGIKVAEQIKSSLK